MKGFIMAEWHFIREPFILNTGTLGHALFLSNIPKEVIELAQSYYIQDNNSEWKYIIKKPDEPMSINTRRFSRLIDTVAYLYPCYIEKVEKKFPGFYRGFEGHSDFGSYIGNYNKRAFNNDCVFLDTLKDTKRAISSVLNAYKLYHNDQKKSAAITKLCRYRIL